MSGPSVSFWIHACHLKKFIPLEFRQGIKGTLIGIIFVLNLLLGTLTLKAPFTTAADDKFCDIFPNFREK